MRYDKKKSVWDAAEACRKIQEYTAEQTIETYQADPLRRLAVERLFEILGEAFKRIEEVDPSFRDQFSEMGDAIGMRNRISHGYDRVKDATVLDVAQADIPVLMEKLTAWLNENGNP